jgi:hypothetical protein
MRRSRRCTAWTRTPLLACLLACYLLLFWWSLRWQGERQWLLVGVNLPTLLLLNSLKTSVDIMVPEGVKTMRCQGFKFWAQQYIIDLIVTGD